jgi:hypothetical protein
MLLAPPEYRNMQASPSSKCGNPGSPGGNLRPLRATKRGQRSAYARAAEHRHGNDEDDAKEQEDCRDLLPSVHPRKNQKNTFSSTVSTMLTTMRDTMGNEKNDPSPRIRISGAAARQLKLPYRGGDFRPDHVTLTNDSNHGRDVTIDVDVIDQADLAVS